MTIYRDNGDSDCIMFFVMNHVCGGSEDELHRRWSIEYFENGEQHYFDGEPLFYMMDKPSNIMMNAYAGEYRSK